MVETDVKVEAVEETKRKEIPSHDGWAAFIGTLDVSKIPAEEANAFVDKFGEWLKLQEQIEEADKKIETEKDDAAKSKLEEEKLALEEKTKQLEDEKNKSAADAEEKLKSSDENEEEIILESKEGVENSENSNKSDEWSKTEAHWKKWCADKNYIYDQNEEDKQKEGFAFRYYSTPEKQAAGEYEARVHYVDKNLAKVATHDGKPASFEFWQSFAKEAGKNNRIINFDKTKNAENQAKLYLACKILGVETSNVDETKLNFENAFKEMSDEEKAIAQKVLGLDENGKKLQQQEPANNQEQEPVNNEDKKDYKYWRDAVDKTRLKDGQNAEFDFEAIKEPEDKARAYLATRALGVKAKNVDPTGLDIDKYIPELPKTDQIRLMVANKKETGFYHGEDSIIDQAAGKRTGDRTIITEKVKNKEAGYEVGSESLKEKRQGAKLSKEVMEKVLNSRDGK